MSREDNWQRPVARQAPLNSPTERKGHRSRISSLPKVRQSTYAAAHRRSCGLPLRASPAPVMCDRMRYPYGESNPGCHLERELWAFWCVPLSAAVGRLVLTTDVSRVGAGRRMLPEVGNVGNKMAANPGAAAPRCRREGRGSNPGDAPV